MSCCLSRCMQNAGADEPHACMHAALQLHTFIGSIFLVLTEFVQRWLWLYSCGLAVPFQHHLHGDCCHVAFVRCQISLAESAVFCLRLLSGYIVSCEAAVPWPLAVQHEESLHTNVCLADIDDWLISFLTCYIHSSIVYSDASRAPESQQALFQGNSGQVILECCRAPDKARPSLQRVPIASYRPCCNCSKWMLRSASYAWRAPRHSWCCQQEKEAFNFGHACTGIHLPKKFSGSACYSPASKPNLSSALNGIKCSNTSCWIAAIPPRKPYLSQPGKRDHLTRPDSKN